MEHDMATRPSFLKGVLLDGVIRMDSPPEEHADKPALAVIRPAYEAYCLSIAGPALPLDIDVALAAGRVLEWSAWFLLNPTLPIETDAVLRMPMLPTKPAQHLSADLLLRFLPTLHRRALVLMQTDALPETLERTLREWPLSGVLADITDAPLTAAGFGHVGLDLLYAERLAAHERSAWFPTGAALEHVELVWNELGKNVAACGFALAGAQASAKPQAAEG
jgi:hypothetical protein